MIYTDTQDPRKPLSKWTKAELKAAFIRRHEHLIGALTSNDRLDESHRRERGALNEHLRTVDRLLRVVERQQYQIEALHERVKVEAANLADDVPF